MRRLEEFEVTVIPAESELNAAELLEALSGLDNGRVQVFDEAAIAGGMHVKLAFLHAHKAFEEGRNISKDKGLEIMLRAAASRQITEAVQRVGIKDPKRIVIGFVGTGEEARILERLKARRKGASFGKGTVAEKFGLDASEPIEDQIIAKMVMLQVG